MVILVIAVCYDRYILPQNKGHLLRVRCSSINVAVSRELAQRAEGFVEEEVAMQIGRWRQLVVYHFRRYFR